MMIRLTKTKDKDLLPCRHFLQKAAKGVYNIWSFRDTPPWVKDGYFREIDKNHLMLLPHIKKMVTFSYLNLAEDIYPSLLNNTNAMDVIFCRNVLMCFAPRYAKAVVQRFYRSLIDSLILVPVRP
jgi:chemotaxis protein methyltransferase CheR